MCTMTKGGCVAGWNLTGNAVSAEFDGSDEQERKELSVSQAVEIAAGALDDLEIQRKYVARSMPFHS